MNPSRVHKHESSVSGGRHRGRVSDRRGDGRTSVTGRRFSLAARPRDGADDPEEAPTALMRSSVESTTKKPPSSVGDTPVGNMDADVAGPPSPISAPGSYEVHC